METKFPFTSYDFWAYLSAGFLLLFAVDYVAQTNLLMRESWTVVQSVLAFSCAYAAGHVVASLSSFVFERLLVGKLLGAPRDVLFGGSKAPRFIRFCMPTYFQTLPVAVRNSVHAKAAALNVGDSSEALFLAALSNARANPAVMSRLDNFLNMYGFCRNASLVSFIDAGLLYWFWSKGEGNGVTLTGCYVALALGVGMTLRYLKFYRQYAFEVFTSFAHSKETEKTK